MGEIKNKQSLFIHIQLKIIPAHCIQPLISSASLIFVNIHLLGIWMAATKDWKKLRTDPETGIWNISLVNRFVGDRSLSHNLVSCKVSVITYTRMDHGSTPLWILGRHSGFEWLAWLSAERSTVQLWVRLRASYVEFVCSDKFLSQSLYYLTHLDTKRVI